MSIQEQGRKDDEGPGVVVSPPVLFLAALVAGLSLQLLAPVRFVNSLLIQLATGVTVIIVGFGLGGWAVRTLMRAGVNPRPHSPVSSLVTHGPFRFSRNPVYLSGILVLTGVAVAVDTLWLIVLTLVGFVVISFQVRREERYLEARFGEEYRKYLRSVRRWI